MTQTKHIKGIVKVGGLEVPATMDLTGDSYIIRTEAGPMYTGKLDMAQ